MFKLLYTIYFFFTLYALVYVCVYIFIYFYICAYICIYIYTRVEIHKYQVSLRAKYIYMNDRE